MSFDCVTKPTVYFIHRRAAQSKVLQVISQNADDTDSLHIFILEDEKLDNIRFLMATENRY